MILIPLEVYPSKSNSQINAIKVLKTNKLVKLEENTYYIIEQIKIKGEVTCSGFILGIYLNQIKREIYT